MRVAGVVLAAGFSRRLGQPKQLVRLGGESLLGRALRVAAGAGLAPVIAVVRERAWVEEGCAPKPVQIVVNEEAAEGMASSVRLGVGAAVASMADSADLVGVVLLTCDQPLVRPEHLRALIGDGTEVRGSAYAGRVGVPAFFPFSAFERLRSLEGDQGARDLLRGAASVADEALRVDVDTEEDVREAERYFSGGAPEGVTG